MSNIILQARLTNYCLALAILTGCAAGDLSQESALLRVQTQTESNLDGNPSWDTSAPCEIEVVGTGRRKVEEEYLARVVYCENPITVIDPATMDELNDKQRAQLERDISEGRKFMPDQALEIQKAQAIAARSWLFAALRDGTAKVENGPQAQVYGCNRDESTMSFRVIQQAVRETERMVLRYKGKIVQGFFVSGSSNLDSVTCRARPSERKEGNEKFVTFNWDASRSSTIAQPVDINRGCLSTNGTRCLGRAGYRYKEILRFYYGPWTELDTIKDEELATRCMWTLPKEFKKSACSPSAKQVPGNHAAWKDLDVEPASAYYCGQDGTPVPVSSTI